MSRQLKHVPFENLSGYVVPGRNITTIKPHQFVLKEGLHVTGDAPKDIVQIYEYRPGIRKDNIKTWPTYIVKLGHKWYPNESITEQLLSAIGKELDINIASSKLYEMESNIRFCSEHFHSSDQVLNHGAGILSGFFDEPNNEWLDKLEQDKKLKQDIHIDIVREAIIEIYPSDYTTIINDLMNMLLFDCFVGNNDRHYYNWGIITHTEGKHEPYFAPIYDTARAIWWNNPDKYIKKLQKNVSLKQRKLSKYVESSYPKITIPSNPQCNHFELIQYLKHKKYIGDAQIVFWSDENILRKICDVIDQKFRYLMVEERRELIKETLELRYYRMQKILK